MKKSKLIQTLTLLIVFGAAMLTEPVSVARTSRKKSAPKSSPRSASKSSGSRQSSGSSSHRVAPPSRSGISSRQSSGFRSSIPRGTTRGSRKIVPERGMTSNTRGTGRIYTPRTPRSNLNASGLRDSNGRISRKGDALSSYQDSTLGSSRTVRKYSSHHDYPYTHRSLYHYYRSDYPSRRIFYWIAWPDCCRPICYTWGPSFTFGYFWPYYHRKFIFISLGGWWPCYTYRRYYWYGCHPYRWYGDCPPEYVIAGDTYNYYYYSDDAPRQEAVSEAQKKLEEKPLVKPEKETQADRYFEEAVKAFEAGDYDNSAARFNDAQELAPDDIVLPFAYVQALFAGGEYKKAVGVLRPALMKASPEKEGVFYPRGLYSEDSVLQKQVGQLAEVVESKPFDADLRLLLGYQLLGTGRLDEAVKHLQSARLDCNNSQAATVLIDLLEKLRKADNNNVEPNQKQAEKPDSLKFNSQKAKSTDH